MRHCPRDGVPCDDDRCEVSDTCQDELEEGMALLAVTAEREAIAAELHGMLEKSPYPTVSRTLADAAAMVRARKG